MTRDEFEFHMENNCFTHAAQELRAHDQAQREEIAQLRAALKHWLHTYAWDECDEKDVAASRAFIRKHGGTLAYIAGLLRGQKQQAALAKEVTHDNAE